MKTIRRNEQTGLIEISDQRYVMDVTTEEEKELKKLICPVKVGR